MEWIYNLIKVLFILIGIATLIIGRFTSDKFLMRHKEGYEIIDKKKYIRYSRTILYFLGLCYIFFGIVMMFIKGWPTVTGYIIILSLLITIINMIIVGKYIKKIK